MHLKILFLCLLIFPKLNGQDNSMSSPVAPLNVVVMNYPNLESIHQLEKLELGVELPHAINRKVQNFIDNVSGEKLNPFLEWEVRLYAEFSNLEHSSEPIIIDGFYTQDFDSWMKNMENIPDITGQKSCTDEMYQSFGGYEKKATPYPFLLRFAPPFTGSYSAKVILEINGEVHSTSELITFHVVESDNDGYLSVGENQRFLKKGNSTFYPIGLNMPWPETNEFWDPVFSKKIKQWNNDIQKSVVINSQYRLYPELPRAYDKYKETINHFADNGVNLVRMIMCPSSNDIEWEELGNYSKRLHMAQEMDEILELCEKKDIYLLWNFQIHYSFQNSVDAYYSYWAWDSKKDGIPFCYKTLVEEDGPFLIDENEPYRFFVNEEAKRFYKQRLRYILARWGYSTNIGMFELYSEINASGFKPFAYVAEDPNNDGWKIIRDWQVEMAEYVKSNHNGKSHLLTASFAGQKNARDDVFFSPDLDIMSTNDYDMSSPSFNEFIINAVSKKYLNEGMESVNSYTRDNFNVSQRNVKPLIFSEMGSIDVDIFCRSFENYIEMNRSQWQGLFSGLAGGFNWLGSTNLGNTAIYDQNQQFMAGHDFDGANWHPGSSELSKETPSGWVFNEKFANGMMGKNNHADLMYLRSGDGNYAIGVLTNRTYNVYSAADCFDTIWSNQAVIPEHYQTIKDTVLCGKGKNSENLYLKGMNTGKYYLNFFHPSNLVAPFHTSKDWGPNVEMDVAVNGTENDYIVLFMAQRRNHEWVTATPTEKELVEIIGNNQLWENATFETTALIESNSSQLNVNVSE